MNNDKLCQSNALNLKYSPKFSKKSTSSQEKCVINYLCPLVKQTLILSARAYFVKHIHFKCRLSKVELMLHACTEEVTLDIEYMYIHAFACKFSEIHFSIDG